MDIKTGGVYFQVQRNSIYNATNTVIPYQVERLNVGGAMNLATGTFTAPTNGIYSFSFTTQSNSIDGASVFLRVNGGQIASSVTHTQFTTISLSSIVKLKKGDKVDVSLYEGTLHDYDDVDGHYYTTFNGMLVEADLLN